MPKVLALELKRSVFVCKAENIEVWLILKTRYKPFQWCKVWHCSQDTQKLRHFSRWLHREICSKSNMHQTLTIPKVKNVILYSVPFHSKPHLESICIHHFFIIPLFLASRRCHRNLFYHTKLYCIERVNFFTPSTALSAVTITFPTQFGCRDLQAPVP